MNRVGDVYFDQLEWNGHGARRTDLELFAELGIRAMRYPVAWERSQSGPNGPPNLSWADDRLCRLRELGVRPIVGLVHHGSGPRHTSLVDPAFPDGLAAYARVVAERFPWVNDYTPVNEPLTTARFSGLYGHWYPHGQDERTFARALLIQCRAVSQAMAAIREVNPNARLVQTEDLGKTYGTPPLQDQVEFDNIRRWASFDLLCGRIDPSHRMWGHFLWAGVSEPDLEWFLEHPCHPDIVGINHYLTSERFLDHRIERYPGTQPGGNGRCVYVDLEAVRVNAAGVAGPRGLLREVWDRYRLPTAITEVHLGCTREEQMRWLLESWNTALSLRKEGVDLRAITAWSLLGAYEWDSLLTCCDGHYEPGVYDLRGPAPRPTAIAGMIREMAAGRTPRHPVLSVPGWWRRPLRFLHPPSHVEDPAIEARQPIATPDSRRIPPLVIAGAAGVLGSAFARLCDMRGIPHRAAARQNMDVADTASVEQYLDEVRPWAVVNAAGMSRVDDAEEDPDRCFRENVDGAATLAAACGDRGIALLTFSADLVFDGKKLAPYTEDDAVSPLNVYGQSKVTAERETHRHYPKALIVRSSAFFGPWDTQNFVAEALGALSEGRPFRAADDAIVSPTYVPDLVHVCLDLLLDGESGIWHLTNRGAVTWCELASKAARMAGLDTATLIATPTYELGLVAERPLFTVMGSIRGMLLPSLDVALECYFADSGENWKRRQERGSRSRRGAAVQTAA